MCDHVDPTVHSEPVSPDSLSTSAEVTGKKPPTKRCHWTLPTFVRVTWRPAGHRSSHKLDALLHETVNINNRSKTLRQPGDDIHACSISRQLGTMSRDLDQMKPNSTNFTPEPTPKAVGNRRRGEHPVHVWPIAPYITPRRVMRCHGKAIAYPYPGAFGSRVLYEPPMPSVIREATGLSYRFEV